MSTKKKKCLKDSKELSVVNPSWYLNHTTPEVKIESIAGAPQKCLNGKCQLTVDMVWKTIKLSLYKNWME